MSNVRCLKFEVPASLNIKCLNAKYEIASIKSSKLSFSIILKSSDVPLSLPLFYKLAALA